MEWTDDAIVLGTRRHGEESVILEVLTRDHGRHLGLVRGGSGARMRPVLQPGNTVRAVWRARLDQHLGHFSVDALHLRAARLFERPHGVYAVTHLAALTRLLPERDPHNALFEGLEVLLDHIENAALAAALVVRYEIRILADLGFGLELDRCAATGQRDGLAYVSPRTGRAVTREAGAPWHDRLLRLPAFIAGEENPRLPTLEEIDAGFALSGYFIGRRVLDPRGEGFAPAREGFIGAVRRALGGADPGRPRGA